jgi:hypothetical protein
VLPKSIKRTPPRRTPEEEGSDYVPTVSGSFEVELVAADEKARVYAGSSHGYGGKAGGGFPPSLGAELQAYWLAGYVLLIGNVYNETRPQWGELEPVRVFWKLPRADRIDRAKMGRALYDAGMEYVRQKIPQGAGDYFRRAGEMDPRYAPVTCAVTGVAANDVLNVREEASPSSAWVGQIPPNATTALKLGPSAKVGRRQWLFVQYEEVSGWVNGTFLKCPPPAPPSGAKPGP